MGFEENVSFGGVACFDIQLLTRERGHLQVGFILGKFLGESARGVQRY